LIVLASLIVAATVGWTALYVAGELRAARDEMSRGRSMMLLQLFTPGLGAVQADPRALLVWQPLAKTARQLFPAEFATLDRAAGATFPFTAEQLQAAHAQWTAEWLAWEYAHDAEYKLKAAAVEHEIGAQEASPFLRSKLDAVEREKLGLYQRRYQEYVRVAKALQALSA
jgi:hypothetical protein